MIGLAFAALIGLLGASIGSFLNVVIYRLPLGISLVRPPSRCPSCETPIRPWHNLPVFGWLWLRGRCATCKVKLSLRYPAIELAVGLIAIALFHQFSGGIVTPDRVASPDFIVDIVTPTVAYLIFASILVAIIFIDLDWFIIPDVLSLPGIPLGIAITAVAGHAIGITWLDALIGAVAGSGVLIMVILVYGWITGRMGMGGGDWKLLGLIGAWLGWQDLPSVLLLASLQGLLFAIVLGRAFAVDTLPADPMEEGGKPFDMIPANPVGEDGEVAPMGQLAIPFGPFLALAALESLLFRDELHDLMASWMSLGA